MQILITLAIALVLTIAADRNGESLMVPYLRSLATVGCVVLPWLVSSLWLKPGVVKNHDLTRFRRQRDCAERVFVATWIASNAIVLLFLKWDQVVRSNLGLANSFLLDELLILAPVVLPWFGWWALERDCDRFSATLQNGDSSHRSPPQSFAQLCRYNLRQGFLLPLAPVLAIVAIDDLLGFLPSIPEHRSLFYSPVLLGTPFAVPVILRCLWDVRPMSAGPVSDRIRQVLDRTQTKLSGVYLWNSQQRIVNAAIAGIRPGPRYLFLSDGLIERLSPDEVEAVVAHEVGHLRNLHSQFILLSLALPFLGAIVLLECIEHSSDYFVPTQDPQFVVVLFILAVWLLFNRVHARMLEHHADLDACRILSGSGRRIDESSVVLFSQALRKVASRTRGHDWWHPTIECRLALLDTFLRNQAYRDRFDARVLAVHRLIGGFTVMLALAAIGLALVGQ